MISRVSAAPLALIATLAFACADPAGPAVSPLSGLVRVSANDTTPNAPPPQPAAPGSFHGTVRGYSPGPDTLNTAVRLPNVTVTAYPRVVSSTDTVGVGPLQAQVVTNAQGEFQLPTMPAGEYVVTFNPPSDSRYRGGWTIATASSTSNQGAWWIMLPAR